VRDFLKHIPKERRQFDTGQTVARRLEPAHGRSSIRTSRSARQDIKCGPTCSLVRPERGHRTTKPRDMPELVPRPPRSCRAHRSRPSLQAVIVARCTRGSLDDVGHYLRAESSRPVPRFGLPDCACAFGTPRGTHYLPLAATVHSNRPVEGLSKPALVRSAGFLLFPPSLWCTVMLTLFAFGRRACGKVLRPRLRVRPSGMIAKADSTTSPNGRDFRPCALGYEPARRSQ
jgi:hypothetical protein